MTSLPPPPRWMKCPRKGQTISGNKLLFMIRFSKEIQKIQKIQKSIKDMFVPFKVPLDSRYDSQVDEEYRFTPEMFIRSCKVNI